MPGIVSPSEDLLRSRLGPDPDRGCALPFAGAYTRFSTLHVKRLFG